MNAYRRQPFDKVNPRNVHPSRHTIFIRGLPGNTDVNRVRDYFVDETSSKCSIEFFSLSEDKMRFSVAIRFKTHEMAREMLIRYNGKNLMGRPVEVTWFKDLKKARSRMNEEQRSSGMRGFRGQFRGGFHGNDRRANFVPNFSGSMADRARSISSGIVGQNRNIDRNSRRRSRSRSHSVTSRSSLRSRSRSRSRSNRRLPERAVQSRDHIIDSPTFGDRPNIGEMDTAQVCQKNVRNRSTSNSSSRSSSYRSNNENQNSINAPPAAYRNRSNRFSFTERNSNFAQGIDRVVKQKPYDDFKHIGSPKVEERHTVSFSNDPAPNEGSSLLSGLIQLKSKRKVHSPNSNNLDKATHSGSRRLQSTSVSSGTSRSVSSRLSKSNEKRGSLSGKRQKRCHLTPREVRHHSRSRAVEASKVRIEKPFSPASRRPEFNYRHQDSNKSGEFSSEHESCTDSLKRIQHTFDSERWLAVNSTEPQQLDKQNVNDSENSVGVSPKPDSTHKNSDKEFISVDITSNVKATDKERQSFIQQRKSILETEYKRDCETFAVVIRMLISKDTELEPRLMPLLKEILHERGQRCIAELRDCVNEDQDSNVKGIASTR